MSKILIVDDNKDLSTIMAEYLVAIGHSVELACNGAEADQRLSAFDFDLLILDWELPDTVGPDICRRYRESGGTAGVMMLTGRKSTDDMVEGLDSGADDYLTKPFNIKIFTARVDAILRRAGSESQGGPRLFSFDESLVGKTFADCYIIDEVLGEGGMGIVYKARHNTIKRCAAIKVLTGQYQDPDAKMRFEREAKAMSLLDHPNLVKIYEFGFHRRKVPYIIMEYLEGAPLSRIIKDEGSVSYQAALPLFLQICDALAHAHAKGIIHRDMKPSNIILSSDRKTARVLDLGLAKIIETEPSSLELTGSGEVFGSPYYMSPEQCTNSSVDWKSDLYSVACVIYETLSGERPFNGSSFVEIANAKLNKKAESLCQKFPQKQIPAALDRAILKALELQPEKRQADLNEFRQQLAKVLEAESEKSQGVLSYIRGFLNKKEERN